MTSFKPNPEGVEAVRRYVSLQLGKSREEKIAFNEGVMAASFALGAFIDTARPLPDSDAAIEIMEAAFESMTRVRLPRKAFGSPA